ncbi:elongator complex protein 6-like [Babylonia areolata]|uniref:elongator complex protein 6-like n=1 Tax=Babylonia areolata TaxID=304850 RepID=UPI003FD5184B
MHSNVNTFLGFDGGCIPNKQCVVIGQAENIHGSFILHQIVSASLKEHKPVCLVSFIQKFHHYNTVSQKIGTSLKCAVEAKHFQFFDGLDELASMFYPKETTPTPDRADLLDVLKENIMKVLSDTRERTSNDIVLVMEDVSVLISMGFPFGDVCLFIQDMIREIKDLWMDSSLPQPNGPSIVVLCSYDEEDKDTFSLWHFLVNLSTLDVNVTGLQTGYCKDVHGQACVTWRNGMGAPERNSVTTKTRQFKLSDNNVEFFAAGTSAAVL